MEATLGISSLPLAKSATTPQDSASTRTVKMSIPGKARRMRARRGEARYLSADWRSRWSCSCWLLLNVSQKDAVNQIDAMKEKLKFTVKSLKISDQWEKIMKFDCCRFARLGLERDSHLKKRWHKKRNIFFLAVY